MIDPERLLDHARDLLAPKKGAPNQSDLRRAISSAYYALFHHLLTAAADHIVGSSQANRKRPEYSLVYRSPQHRSMAEACEAMRKATLSSMYTRACGRPNFSHEIRNCATVFVDLQRMRHAADYDPAQRFTKAQAAAVVAMAAYGMRAFDTSADGEKRLFLHLLVFKVRD